MLHKLVKNAHTRKVATVLFISIVFVVIRLFQPIYADEIVYLMIGGRFLVEGGALWNSFPQCTGSTITESPLFFYPAFFLRSFIYQISASSVSFLDFLAVTKSIAIFFLLNFLCKRIDTSEKSNIHPVSLLMFLGSCPFFIVMNRPESSLCFLVLISLVFLEFKKIDYRINRYSSIIMLLLFYWQSTLHPHVCAFFIYFLYVIIQLSPNRLFSILGGFLAVCTCVFSFMLWSTYYSCPRDEFLRKFFKSYSFHLSELFTEPYEAVNKIILFAAEILKTPYYLIFKSTWQSGMVTISSSPSQALLYTVNALIFAVSSSIFVYLFFSGIKSIHKLTVRKILLSDKTFFTLAVSLLIWASIRGKYDYVVPLPWMILLLIYVKAYINSDNQALPFDRFFNFVRRFSGFIVLLSLVFLFSYHTFTVSTEELLASRSGSLGIPRVDYMKTSIKQIPPECNFVREHEEGRLLIDESSLFLVPERKNVAIAMFGVTGNTALSIFTPHSLVDLNIDSFLVSCSRSPQLINYSDYHVGDICCASMKEKKF